MALVLSRCKFQATYKQATNDFIVHDSFAGANGLWPSLVNAGIGLPASGLKLYFTVQYADRSASQLSDKRDAFEVGEYKILPNGRLKLVGNPETSSNGTAAVNWSGGERELVFLSSAPGSLLSLLGDKRPKEAFLGLTTSNIAINTLAADTNVDVSNEVTFEPAMEDSNVMVTLSCYTNISWSSATNLGFRVFVNAHNGSSWVDRQAGYYLNNGSGTNRIRQKISYQPVLVTERDNGLFRFKLSANLLYPNLELHVSSARLHIREIF